MKLTLIRTARETGKETFSTWPSGTLMEKMKTENKAGHISALRSLIPHITGSNGHYPCIDKLPRICPAAEYARSKEGERYLKTYNGLVQIEVSQVQSVNWNKDGVQYDLLQIDGKLSAGELADMAREVINNRR